MDKDDFTEKFTFTIEGGDYRTSFIHEGYLKRDELLEWFDSQVLPALGFYKKDEANG